MKVAVIVAVVLLGLVSADKKPFDNQRAAILHSEQHYPDETGAHSFDFESENGIKIHISGSQGDDGGANSIGSWSYVMENGDIAEFKFVANEKGYHPESHLLPVGPEFPHPIPDFVHAQIAFAKAEDERRAREGKRDQ